MHCWDNITTLQDSTHSSANRPGGLTLRATIVSGSLYAFVRLGLNEIGSENRVGGKLPMDAMPTNTVVVSVAVTRSSRRVMNMTGWSFPNSTRVECFVEGLEHFSCFGRCILALASAVFLVMKWCWCLEIYAYWGVWNLDCSSSVLPFYFYLII